MRALISSLGKLKAVLNTANFDVRNLLITKEEAWPYGYSSRIVIWRPQIQAPHKPLAGFVLGSSEFYSLVTFIN